MSSSLEPSVSTRPIRALLAFASATTLIVVAAAGAIVC
jgi:hypothetical protein